MLYIVFYGGTKHGNEYKVEKTKFGTKTSHPSYGTLLFNRAYGWKTPLFGSSVEHRNVITMELRHADITRGLNRDDIYGHNPIVRVEMSYSQFAEAITSLGQGTGVPVTIRYTEKDGEIPPCDFVSKREQFTEEFKEQTNKAMKNSKELIDEVVELFSSKKTLTKTDKENILEKLNMLNYDIGSNIGFIADQFNEQMDKTVMEAKGEIESFCQNKINAIASATLVEHRDEILQLENPVDIESE
jgi:hypothetical protein